MTTVPVAPALGHVDDVQLMQTGTWPASTGSFTVTATKIAAAIEALSCSAVRRPVLKLGHVGEVGDVGTPAVGWVDNLRSTNEGQSLVGDFRGMPGWMTSLDDDGISIMAAAYPDRSVEGQHDYHCTLGHIHPFVVTAVALLGVEEPAIGTLESLADLYGVAASAASGNGDPVILTTVGGVMPRTVLASATTDDVRTAFYNGPGQNMALWIREMYVDPPELIVNNDETSTLSRCSYTVANDGTVSFGMLEPVKVQYVAARKAAGDIAASYTTRETGRPVVASQTPAAPADGSTGEEPAVAFSDEQITTLRQLAGVALDADEATIVAALGEAIGDEAEPPPPAVAATTQVTTPPTDTPAPQPPPSGIIPEGAIVIDAATFALIQEQGRQGAMAAARLRDDDRDRALDAAVSAGKFPSASRKAWATNWDKDPQGTKATLDAMPANLVPVSHIGTPGDPNAVDLDAEFASLYPTTNGR